MPSFPLLNIQEVRNGSTRKKFHHSRADFCHSAFISLRCQYYSPHTPSDTRGFPMEIKIKEGWRELRRWICNNKCGKHLHFSMRNSAGFTRKKDEKLRKDGKSYGIDEKGKRKIFAIPIIIRRSLCGLTRARKKRTSLKKSLQSILELKASSIYATRDEHS